MRVFTTKAQLVSAVAEWTADPTSASGVHGHISSWDTSRVTDMQDLFCGWTGNSPTCDVRNQQFNDDINAWNVGQVTNMHAMFHRAFRFNQELNAWNVNNVVDMAYTFMLATSFDQELDSWDVSQVTSMYATFFGAPNFNQQLNTWNLATVATMRSMFSPRIWSVGSSLSTPVVSGPGPATAT